MIDLRKKDLPNTVTVNGKSYSIYTDFRKWLEFGELIKTQRKYNEFYFLFKNKNPHDDLSILDIATQNEQVDFIPALMNFYTNPNATPTGDGEENYILDYILDGEYIVGSFMQVYGIDLTSCDMHWHKFKALFVSLPDDCKIKSIIAKRSYKEDKRKMETILAEEKRAWTLPETKEDKSEIMQSINDEFYACV